MARHHLLSHSDVTAKVDDRHWRVICGRCGPRSGRRLRQRRRVRRAHRGGRRRGEPPPRRACCGGAGRRDDREPRRGRADPAGRRPGGHRQRARRRLGLRAKSAAARRSRSRSTPSTSRRWGRSGRRSWPTTCADDGGLADPAGIGPTFWFQQMDGRGRSATGSTSTCIVPHDEAEARIAAAIAAGGHMVSDDRRRRSGSWPTPRATRRASARGRRGAAADGEYPARTAVVELVECQPAGRRPAAPTVRPVLVKRYR